MHRRIDRSEESQKIIDSDLFIDHILTSRCNPCGPHDTTAKADATANQNIVPFVAIERCSAIGMAPATHTWPTMDARSLTAFPLAKVAIRWIAEGRLGRKRAAYFIPSSSHQKTRPDGESHTSRRVEVLRRC